MKTFVLLAMVFMHIADDYYLQGILAQLKQKKWWEKNCPSEMYRNDWKIALLEHAFSWTFMMMLPAMAMMICEKNVCERQFAVLFIANMAVHAITDHMKANQEKISLTMDQCIHLVQILLTWTCIYH